MQHVDSLATARIDPAELLLSVTPREEERRSRDPEESSSPLDRAILLSRCYFAIAHLVNAGTSSSLADFFDIERKSHWGSQ